MCLGWCWCGRSHRAERPLTLVLSPAEAQAIFARATAGSATAEDARRFSAHMLVESARMSARDGLVMQLHAGVRRNHDPALLSAFGPDKGADIPLSADWTDGLAPLLGELGNHPNLTLVLFTLDESTYARELAPLAGYYSAVRLGPPWWFHDSRNGMRRYLDSVVETAGVANLAGFNDDTRAFLSIPARHTVWRRVVADWVADLHARGAVDWEDALAMAHDLARTHTRTRFPTRCLGCCFHRNSARRCARGIACCSACALLGAGTGEVPDAAVFALYAGVRTCEEDVQAVRVQAVRWRQGAVLVEALSWCGWLVGSQLLSRALACDEGRGMTRHARQPAGRDPARTGGGPWAATTDWLAGGGVVRPMIDGGEE